MLLRSADGYCTFGYGNLDHSGFICRIRVEQRVASPLLRGRAFLFFSLYNEAQDVAWFIN